MNTEREYLQYYNTLENKIYDIVMSRLYIDPSERDDYPDIHHRKRLRIRISSQTPPEDRDIFF